MSDSVRPHGLQPTRLLCPCDFPGKSTGVGSRHLLLDSKKKQERNQINKIINEKEVITDTAEIHRITRDYYNQLYANEMDDLDEMEKKLQLTPQEYEGA